ncbi:MAG: 4Fe-4S dicluster domain-containing protein [Anaerolineae bacterium]|nr:4Fe-4S dicluster domain-containing protein [Anaerolineae bacterium]
MEVVIPVENKDTLAALRGFLKLLLERNVVEALLLPMETSAGAITPALVTDPALLAAANPLAPVMGLNAARVVGAVSVREPRGRIGALLRPCELRALVELVKLQQASLDDLVTIGIDCLGTYGVADYMAIRAAGGVELVDFLAVARDGLPQPREGYAFRDACAMCENTCPEGADITIQLFGAELDVGLPLVLSDELAEQLGLSPAQVVNGRRAEVVHKVVRLRTAERDARLAQMERRLAQEGVEGVLAACVRCHNCMAVCPICYCKTCLFRSPVFEHEPAQYMRWASRKGACRLPPDTMLFHLTRLNHMVLSCVGCGMCTDACPAELPVARLFRAVGRQVQAVFEYVPGRSVEEPLPLITFRENEWMEVGEEK